MKIGIYTNAFREFPIETAFEKIKAAGIEMVELGCGEESGTAHCDPEQLLADEGKLREFTGLLEKYGLKISALSCHGNPISPNEKTRELSVRTMRNAVLLAEKLGLSTIVCFSGCPGDWEGAHMLNWVTTSWPLDYARAYEWQWNERVLPFWREFTQFAREHHLERIALEMHPGQCCYNPKTVKRLRDEVGPIIGVNLDFSHLLWQRMDPILVIRELKGMIYHMHAKDIAFDTQRIKETGLISRTYYSQPTKRSWNFRIIGYGHDVGWWRNVFAELRRVGYEYVASIEFECELTSADYGCRMALKNLQDALLMDDADSPMAWRNHTIRTQKKRDELYGIGK